MVVFLYLEDCNLYDLRKQKSINLKTKKNRIQKKNKWGIATPLIILNYFINENRNDNYFNVMLENKLSLKKLSK